MNKKIIILLYLILISINAFCQNTSRINKQIQKKQNATYPYNSSYIKDYFLFRKATKCIESFLPIQESDTIFILETHGDFSDSALQLTVWNKAKSTSYYSEDMGTTFIKVRNNYTNHIVNLVSKWDLEKIKEEEIENGNMLPSYDIFATRIIFIRQKYRIDMFCFKDFFNLDRDGNDFR